MNEQKRGKKSKNKNIVFDIIYCRCGPDWEELADQEWPPGRFF